VSGLRYTEILLILLAASWTGCTRNKIIINEKPPVGRFILSDTTISINQISFDSALKVNDAGYPSIDFRAFKGIKQKSIVKSYKAVTIENKYLRLVILPEHGKPYSFIYKVTGNEELFIPETAQVMGSPNKTGWWFALGGVEYNMPDEEHGETWSIPWEWEITENSLERKSLKMSVRERRFGLKETVIISVYHDKAYFEADITITNPTDSIIRFQHWINPMWVPGGNKEGLSPDTEFIMPTAEVYVTERSFNNWILDYSPDSSRLQPYTGSPLRFLKYWKGFGDLLAWKLEDGFYSAFCHQKNEGIVRVFPVEINPGCNIWSWGANPDPSTRSRFSGNNSHRGYVEMWGGITHGFDDYYPINPGDTIRWIEWMYPYANTSGLHFANQDLALTFFRKQGNDYELNLCPAGEIKDLRLLVRSEGTKATILDVRCRNANPLNNRERICFESKEEDLELVIIKEGRKIKSLPPSNPSL
jgi:hypothetical protein